MSMRVALITLGDPETMTGGYLYHRRVAEAAPRHDADFLFLSLPERRFPLNALVGRRLLRSALQTADAIVCDSIAAAFLRPPARAARSAAVVAVVHQPPGGIDHGRVRRLFQRRLDHSAYRRMDRIIVASEQLRDDFLARGFGDESIAVVPPGRDAVEVAPHDPVEDLREGRDASLLCVGNWVPRKQILEVLDALELLPDHLVTLHLVGSRSINRSYAAAVDARLRGPLGARVSVHGELPRGRVQRMYEAADAFVLPSLREPYGTVYGEAMAAGLPVIGWRAGNLPYLVEDGREGLLSEPGDIEALAASMRTVAVDAGLRERMAVAAKAKGLQLPTWEQTTAAFYGELRAVVHAEG